MNSARAPVLHTGAAGRTLGAQRYRLALLGRFRLSTSLGPVVLPAAAQRLVARVGLRGPTPRASLADALRPDADEMHALGSVRTVLWRTRQVAPGLLDADGDTVALIEDVDVDVAALLRVAHRVLAGDVGPHDLQVLLEDGEVLPGWDDDWLVPDRERLRQLRMHVLEALADHLTTAGRFGGAMEAALAALRADPLRESAHRAVIRVHAAESNLVAARQAFDDCAAVLSRELGVAPSEATCAALREATGTR